MQLRSRQLPGQAMHSKSRSYREIRQPHLTLTGWACSSSSKLTNSTSVTALYQGQSGAPFRACTAVTRCCKQPQILPCSAWHTAGLEQPSVAPEPNIYAL